MVKASYWYASSKDFHGRENPVGDPIAITDSQPTLDMLRVILQNNANGSPPFKLRIDSDAIWMLRDLVSMPLFKLAVERNDTTDPLGHITIQFDDEFVILVAFSL